MFCCLSKATYKCDEVDGSCDKHIILESLIWAHRSWKEKTLTWHKVGMNRRIQCVEQRSLQLPASKIQEGTLSHQLNLSMETKSSTSTFKYPNSVNILTKQSKAKQKQTNKHRLPEPQGKNPVLSHNTWVKFPLFRNARNSTPVLLRCQFF